MLNNVYGYHIPHGDLFIYGDNINKCLPYIDDAIEKSVEGICNYCSVHNLRVFHKGTNSPIGIFERLRVYRLTKKYSVHSTWDELCQFLERTQQ